MRFYGFVQFWKLAFATVTAVAIGCFALLLHDFSGSGLAQNAETAREYYLYSPSSQAQIKTEIAFLELPFVKGESACFSFSSERDAAAFVEKLLSAKRATLRFTEFAAGTLSYYCYTPQGGAGIVLRGQSVNLHIARRGATVCVGTPLVFGGY